MSGCRYPEHHGRERGPSAAGVIAALVLVLALGSTAAVARVIADLVLAAEVAAGVLAIAVVAAVVVVRRRRKSRQARPPAALVEWQAPVGLASGGDRRAIEAAAPPGRVCRYCRRPIALSLASGLWWATDDLPVGAAASCPHSPVLRNDVLAYPRGHATTHVVTRRGADGRWS